MPRIKSKASLASTPDAARKRKTRYTQMLKARVQDLMDLLDRAESETLGAEYLTSEHTEQLTLRLAENLAWYRKVGAAADRYQAIREAYRSEADPDKQAAMRHDLDEARSALERARAGEVKHLSPPPPQ